MILATLAVAVALSVLPPQCLKDCRLDPAGDALIMEHEGFFPFWYDDLTGRPLKDWRKAKGNPTIGTGHKFVEGDEKLPVPLLGEAAEKLYRGDIAIHERIVNKAVDVPLWPGQFNALTSFEFNTGPGRKGVKDGFTVLRNGHTPKILRHVNGEQHELVPDDFLEWTSAKDARGNKTYPPGLKRRRQAESDTYRLGTVK